MITPALFLLFAALPAEAPSGALVLEQCRVSLIDEAQVPGQEAGTLVEMKVREGAQVKEGAPLGKIDDTKPITMRRVKFKEYETAREQATNDVNVRFAKAATGVAKAEHQKALEANRKQPGTVADIEVKKLELASKKSELQIEQADLEMKVAKLTADTKAAEVDATDADIKLRQIKSPLNGVVVHVYKHLGEWVPPGDPVLHIVGLDRLRVEGFVNATKFDPQELHERPVIVEADLARGRKAQFEGKIVFVSPLVQPGGDYVVYAEVENRQEDGLWLLRPGATATMTVEVK